jgi:hypothetical protein
MKKDHFESRDYDKAERFRKRGEMKAWAKVSPAIEFTKALAQTHKNLKLNETNMRKK